MKSINIDKKNILRGNADNTKEYPAFVVNRCMSYHQPLVNITNTLNSCNVLDNLQHYEFLLHVIPKGKRFAKWTKPKNEEFSPFIAKHYNVSQTRALEILSLLSEEHIKKIMTEFDKGGIVKKSGGQ